jgi:hypothetical protein
MMRFSNKQLISSQQCCLSNKRLTAFNRHQEALNNQKADRLQRELLQQQKTDSSHHNLKEEPSALRSLSIFDSTETEQKMHNGRRPVVEIAICM